MTSQTLTTTPLARPARWSWRRVTGVGLATFASALAAAIALQALFLATPVACGADCASAWSNNRFAIVLGVPALAWAAALHIALCAVTWAIALAPPRAQSILQSAQLGLVVALLAGSATYLAIGLVTGTRCNVCLSLHALAVVASLGSVIMPRKIGTIGWRSALRPRAESRSSLAPLSPDRDARAPRTIGWRSALRPRAESRSSLAALASLAPLSPDRDARAPRTIGWRSALRPRAESRSSLAALAPLAPLSPDRDARAPRTIGWRSALRPRAESRSSLAALAPLAPLSPDRDARAPRYADHLIPDRDARAPRTMLRPRAESRSSLAALAPLSPDRDARAPRYAHLAAVALALAAWVALAWGLAQVSARARAARVAPAAATQKWLAAVCEPSTCPGAARFGVEALPAADASIVLSPSTPTAATLVAWLDLECTACRADFKAEAPLFRGLVKNGSGGLRLLLKTGARACDAQARGTDARACEAPTAIVCAARHAGPNAALDLLDWELAAAPGYYTTADRRQALAAMDPLAARCFDSELALGPRGTLGAHAEAARRIAALARDHSGCDGDATEPWWCFSATPSFAIVSPGALGPASTSDAFAGATGELRAEVLAQCLEKSP